MSIKIFIQGIEETKHELNKTTQKITEGMQKGINKSAFFLQGEVKESIAGRRSEPTSVDTGRFLNSVDVVLGKDEAIVFSDVPYAQHLEFGTSRMNPRRHFNNSKDRNKQKVLDIIDKEITE